MRSPPQRMVCCERCLSASSKSNIGVVGDPLAVAVGTIEIRRHVAPHGGSERREVRIIAGTPEIIRLGLRKILVAVPDRGRHIDVFDRGLLAERLAHGDPQIAKAWRDAGADIENAGY